VSSGTTSEKVVNGSVESGTSGWDGSTSETSAEIAYDKMVVTVKNSAGTMLAMLAPYSNLNQAPGYQVRNIDLLAYKGQTVTLSFAATEDESLQTSFVLGGVSLVTQ
jgi:hypothetical protein